MSKKNHTGIKGLDFVNKNSKVECVVTEAGSHVYQIILELGQTFSNGRRWKKVYTVKEAKKVLASLEETKEEKTGNRILTTLGEMGYRAVQNGGIFVQKTNLNSKHMTFTFSDEEEFWMVSKFQKTEQAKEFKNWLDDQNVFSRIHGNVLIVGCKQFEEKKEEKKQTAKPETNLETIKKSKMPRKTAVTILGLRMFGTIERETYDGTEEYSIITASEARNHDGSLAGWKAGTENGDRECVQIKTTYHNGSVDYSNRWNW